MRVLNLLWVLPIATFIKYYAFTYARVTNLMAGCS